MDKTTHKDKVLDCYCVGEGTCVICLARKAVKEAIGEEGVRMYEKFIDDRYEARFTRALGEKKEARPKYLYNKFGRIPRSLSREDEAHNKFRDNARKEWDRK